MSIRLDKPWIEFSKESIDRVTGHLGVYQLANAGKEIVYIGIAGARTRFGLRGELQKWQEHDDIATSFFRLEVTMAYKTRHVELLQIFLHDFKRLPLANKNLNVKSMGRLNVG